MKIARWWIVWALVLALGAAWGPASAQDGAGLDEYLLFADDFEGGMAAEWDVSAGWAVEQFNNNSLFVARQPGAAWVTGGGGWGDYVFRTAARVDQGGLALSYRWATDTRYIVQWQADGLYLKKEQPRGNFTVLAQTTAPSFGGWHLITIAGEGAHLQVYGDGALWLDYTDPAPLLQGTVGVGALDGSVVGVDNVYVMDLVRSLPAGSSPVAPDMPDPPPAIPPGGPEEGRVADPVITNVTLSNPNPADDEHVTVTVTIANNGTATAQGFDLITIPNYQPTGPNNPGTLQPVGDLEPGASVQMTLSEYWGIDGQFTLRALVTNDWYLTGNPEPPAGYPNRAFDVPVTVGAGGGPPPAGEADLYITQVELSNPNPLPGEAFNVRVYVGNRGRAASDAFDLVVLPTYTAGGPNNPLQPVDIPAEGLGPGAVLYWDFEVLYPAAGTYTLRALVTADWYETGNAEPAAAGRAYDTVITVGEGGGAPPPAAGQPNLVIASANAVVQQSPPRTVVVSWVVQNVGEADSGAFTVRWYAHANNPQVSCSHDIALPVGGAQELSCVYTYPQGGEMHWRIVADEDGEIAESNEADNEWRGTTSIAGSGQAGGRAELVIANVEARALESPEHGVSLTITVRNAGNADAGLFTVEWYPHANSDEVGCSEDVALAAGESQWVQCMYTYPQGGEMHWRAVIDVDNDIPEHDETNNERRGMVQIDP